MSAEVLVFSLLAAVAVITAAGVVLARNPVHSAVALVLSFVNVAGIYVILRAEFLAVAQIIVYTGAILVLVLFVIMLVRQEDLPEFHGGRPVQRLVGFVIGLVLLAQVGVAILTRTVVGQPGPWTPEQVAAVGGNVQAFGLVLYSGFVLPIQVTALLLLMATIGALALARPETKEEVEARRRVATISLAHPRGLDDRDGEPPPALGPGSKIRREAGERDLILTRSGDEFVDNPDWEERRRDD